MIYKQIDRLTDLEINSCAELPKQTTCSHKVSSYKWLDGIANVQIHFPGNRFIYFSAISSYPLAPVIKWKDHYL